MHRPWMTALEMQFAAMQNCGRLREQLSPADDLESVDRQLDGAGQVLRCAEAFSWTADTIDAVVHAAATIPDDTQLADLGTLPNPACWWWWFEHPLPFLVDDDDAYPFGRRAVHGLLLVHGLAPSAAVSSLMVIPFGLFATSDSPFMFPLGWDWKVNESVNNQLTTRQGAQPSTLRRPISRFLAAALVWLEQRILVHTTGPVERHRRKQLARDHAVPLPGDVKVIQLRRAEHEAQPTSDRSVLVEWSCRWIVSGHWRNQPVKDGRKLIYILPYVKGPADQPLKVPTHTVYDVSR